METAAVDGLHAIEDGDCKNLSEALMGITIESMKAIGEFGKKSEDINLMVASLDDIAKAIIQTIRERETK